MFQRYDQLRTATMRRPFRFFGPNVKPVQVHIQPAVRASARTAARLIERRTLPTVQLAAAMLCIASAGIGCVSAAPAGVGNPAKTAATAHQSSGKPTSGVIVQSSVPNKIAVGETVALRLHVSGVTAPDGATVEVRDPSSRDPLVSVRLAQGERRIIEIPYMSRTDGMQFIDITTIQDGRRSVQSVPLRVGSGEVSLKPAGTKRTTAGGEAVISLPATIQ
jgi:hypothetical protein